jgi:hypothetical protein
MILVDELDTIGFIPNGARKSVSFDFRFFPLTAYEL